MDRGHNIVCETVTKTIPIKKKCKKTKRLSEEALQIAEKRREEKQRKKGKIYATECRAPKNSKNSKESLHKRTMQRNKRKQ